MQLRLPTQSRTYMSRQTGASLIEILVSVVIISIGLLGLAALQNTSMRLAYESYVRSQANFIAYDLIDRVRANPGESYVLDANSSLSEQNCFASDSDCTPSDLRDFDLYHWQQRAEELLPDAVVEVTYDDSEQMYAMRLNWEDRIVNDTEIDPDDSVSDETKEFVYHFKIE